MLRMPAFTLQQPASVDEAVRMRAELDSLYLAGGTDLLVNLKHHLQRPAHVIDLRGLPGLDGIEVGADAIRIGALTPLATVERDARVRDIVPGLAEAVASIAGPQHREMGTLGGNVMLDTRCLFYNQTEAWRTALGKCLKADGDWCHVIGSPKACVAAQSSDSVPMLTALGAVLELRTAPGEVREVALADLFTKDGRYDRMHTVPRESLLEAIRIPRPAAGHRSTYRKVRSRQAVDFPQLGVAVAATFDGRTCTAVEIVLGALLPSPRQLPTLDEAIGVEWTDAVVEAVADRVRRFARPQRSIHGDPAWRRHLAGVETRRAMLYLRP
ncbi:MAG: FAD binding domain-containing protein [Alphaproteobacteria bacterium]|nr:FAD binding domain-containing protein [Alphaproteobacteria bacterium]